MSNEYLYVPILKIRPAEASALASIHSGIRGHFTPLMDIPRIDIDPDTKAPKKTLESHTTDCANAIRNCWGVVNPLFVDLMDIPLEDRISRNFRSTHNLIDLMETLHENEKSKDLHPVAALLKLLRIKFVKAIPTTGLDRDKEYNAAISGAIKEDRRGALIRLNEDDLFSTNQLDEQLNNLLAQLEISASDAHLLLDFGSLIGKDENDILITIRNTISELAKIEAWKSLTFAGSGMRFLNRFQNMWKMVKVRYHVSSLESGRKFLVTKIP